MYDVLYENCHYKLPKARGKVMSGRPKKGVFIGLYAESLFMSCLTLLIRAFLHHLRYQQYGNCFSYIYYFAARNRLPAGALHLSLYHSSKLAYLDSNKIQIFIPSNAFS